MAQGGYFYLIIEAIARVLAVLAFFSLTKEFPRVFGGISEHTRIGVIVFLNHVLFEKLGPIVRGVRTVDADYLDGYVGADSEDDPVTQAPTMSPTMSPTMPPTNPPDDPDIR